MSKSVVLSATLIAGLSSNVAFAAGDTSTPLANTPLSTVVVTATRSGDSVPADLIGGSVTVLDAQAMESRQTRVVSDILRDVPGVAVSRFGAVGGLTQIRVRGAESNHVLVLIDGIETSDPYSGEYDFGTLVADGEAKIEILRGQQSALYGSDAIGGVIQYLTLTGTEAPGVRLRAEGGSFGTASTAARFAGVADSLDYALSTTYLHTDGTSTAVNGSRDVGSDSVGATAKAIWSPVDHFKVTVVGRYSYTYADSNDSDDVFSSPLFGRVIDTPGVHSKTTAFYGLLRGELGLLDDRWTHAVTVQLADTRRDGFKGIARTYGDDGDRTKGSFESTLRLGDDAIAHRITLAVDAEREEYRNRDPSGYAFTGKRRSDNLGVVGQYDIQLNEALALGASLRRDDNDRFDDAVTYRAQASYLFAAGTRIRAAGGSGIKNPGYYELFGYTDGKYIGNAQLDPEQSTGWEAGIDQSLLGHAATVGVTYFNNRLKDEIVTRFPPPLFIASPVNLDRDSTQRGVEASLQARLNTRLRIDASYTYLHAREGGEEEVRRPESIASLNVTVSTGDGRGELTFTGRYNGKQQDITFTDPTFATTPIVTLGAYTLINLSAEYTVLEHLSLIGRIENLTDEAYQEIFSSEAAGRAVYAGVRMQF